MREPKRTGVTIENPSSRQAFAELWRYRAVVLWPLLGIISGEIAVEVVLVWASPTLSRHFSLSADRIGVIMATVLFASGLLGPMLGGTLADVCQRAGGPHRTLIVLVGLAILTVPAALFAKVPTVAAASVLLAAFMTLVNAVCVMGTTLFTIVIPNELRGLCAALLLGSSVLLSIGLAPLTVSLLSSVLGGADTLGSALSIVCIATGVLGATTFLLGRRYSLRAPVPAISSR
jgi:MFS family permease